MAKLLIVPRHLTSGPLMQKHLSLDGVTVVESCAYADEVSGEMFLNEHVLIHIIKGAFTLEYDGTEYRLERNEIVFLKKFSSVKYLKSGGKDDGVFEIMMFFLSDRFIREFRNRFQSSSKHTGICPVAVLKADRRFNGFVDSLKPYLDQSMSQEGEIISLKMLELFYDVHSINPDLAAQIFSSGANDRTDIRHTAESKYMMPVSITELAALSGRSLSTFKRDFFAVYGMPPSDWIRMKRLDEAMKMLQGGKKSVTEICFAVGYSNTSHFSRIFSAHYGNPPSFYLNQFSDSVCQDSF